VIERYFFLGLQFRFAVDTLNYGIGYLSRKGSNPVSLVKSLFSLLVNSCLIQPHTGRSENPDPSHCKTDTVTAKNGTIGCCLSLCLALPPFQPHSCTSPDNPTTPAWSNTIPSAAMQRPRPLRIISGIPGLGNLRDRHPYVRIWKKDTLGNGYSSVPKYKCTVHLVDMPKTAPAHWELGGGPAAFKGGVCGR